MTGFGRGEEVYGNRTVSVEIKTINSRYSEYNIRMPRKYSALEESIKKRIAKDISRGKIDVYIQFVDSASENMAMNLDSQLAARYYEQIKELSEKLDIPMDLGVSKLIELSGVMTIIEDNEELDEILNQIMKPLDTALLHLVEMRKNEGKGLAADFVTRLDYMNDQRLKLLELSAGAVDEYREKLHQKVSELLADASIDEARILEEVAIYADHSCVDEELVRLDSHFKQFKNLISENQPVGRKLDFLCQEINREINTTGSKCGVLEMTQIVVEMKSELEKLREQVQNIE